MIEIIELHTGYGDTPVLHNLNLYMQEKEVLLILGPNGHGKTTLLRTISGLMKAWSGKIIYDEVNLVELRPDEIVKMGITHIPQGDLLFPDFTVRENLWMGAYLPVAWGNRKDSIDEVFKIFPILKERSNQLARTLSGGERRMLALGRGLMANSRLFLIDEPSLGLAPKVIDELYENIRMLSQRGLSVILVEENATHALNLADRVYLLEAGSFVREGHPKDLINDPVFQTAYLGI